MLHQPSTIPVRLQAGIAKDPIVTQRPTGFPGFKVEFPVAHARRVQRNLQVVASRLGLRPRGFTSECGGFCLAMKEVRDATARILDHTTLADVNRRAGRRRRKSS